MFVTGSFCSDPAIPFPQYCGTYIACIYVCGDFRQQYKHRKNNTGKTSTLSGGKQTGLFFFFYGNLLNVHMTMATTVVGI